MTPEMERYMIAQHDADCPDRRCSPTTMAGYLHPLPGQVLAVVDFKDDYTAEPELTSDITAANIMTSEVMDPDDPFSNMHKPVIDIDFPVKVIESTTPGHSHLIIDKAMDWETYKLLLRTLVVVGLVEPGYLSASLERGYTAIRLPWVKKQAADISKPYWIDDFLALQ